MRHYLPQISWHSMDAIMSVHFQPNERGEYRIVTAGYDRDMRIWRLEFDDAAMKMHAHFLSNLRSRTHTHAVNVARFSPDGGHYHVGVNLSSCRQCAGRRRRRWSVGPVAV